MANFMGLVFATLKNEGIDTSDMSKDEAVKKFNELKGKDGGTPAEQRKLEEKGISKQNTDSERLSKILKERGRNEDEDFAKDTGYFGFGSLDALEKAHNMDYKPEVKDDSKNWEEGKYTGDDARFNKFHNALSKGKVGENATREMLDEIGLNDAGIKNYMMTNELFNTENNPDTSIRIIKRVFMDGDYRK